MKASASGLDKWSHRLAWWAWGLVLFLLPFNKFGGLRNVCFLILIIALPFVWKQRERRRWPPAFFPALLVVVFAFMSAFSGPYMDDSLSAIGKDLIAQFLLVITAWTLIRNETDVRCSVLCAVGGFAVVSVLSIGEISLGDWSMLSTLEPGGLRGHGKFWSGYSASASLYLPLLTACGMLVVKRRLWKGLLLVLLGLGLGLTLLYGSRSAVLIVAATSLISLVLERHFRALAGLAILVCMLWAGLYSQADLGYLNKYKSLANPDTYITNEGLSMRFSVWKGTAELIAERPLLGYGYGWKKLAWAINDGGFGERWRTTTPDVANYYLADAEIASYGRVNPHNYALQVIFEIGLLGFACVLAFWGLVFSCCINLVRDKREAISAWGGVLILTLIAYFMSNITNGYWVGGVANLALAIAGMALALRYGEEGQ